MTTYLLDTSIASHVIKGDLPQVRARLVAVPMHEVAVSVLTQAELLYGVARRGHPQGLAARVREFLARVVVLPWTSDAATAYADLRAACEAAGASPGPIDLLIVAHAKAIGAVAAGRGNAAILVTRDAAMTRAATAARIAVEDWSR